LPALVRDVRIEYTATSLVAPEKMQFKYKLEGRDKHWNDAGNRRQAFYADLEPGAYRFRVIASNNSGVWNEEGATLEFSVAPAYWQTWWFRALCVAALAALLWTLYRLRVRQIRRQFSMQLDARVAERTRIARELHDTLLQSFQGLLFSLRAVLRTVPPAAPETREALGGIIEQASRAVTESRDAVQGLRASAMETNDVVDTIRRLTRELAAEVAHRPAPSVRIELQGAPRVLHPIVRDEAVRIAHEALRNAFRHAQASEVEIDIRYDQRQFSLRVRDDGKGVDAAVLDAGGREGHFGLRGMRERADLIGGKVRIWSAPEIGTEIELTVPAVRAYRAPPSTGSGLLAKLGRQAVNDDS
jgi:signal transduction histidine kinase